MIAPPLIFAGLAALFFVGMQRDNPDALPPIVAEFQNITKETADNPVELNRLERFAFYDRAKSAFAIVQTGETRLYGNIILKKGVIGA